MKILIMGGTGMIGGHAALYLQAQGHAVTIGARTQPQAGSPIATMPFLQGDFIAETFAADDLATFDAIVFAAGSDIRHVPEGEDYAAHVLHANGTAVPKFAALAKEAGVRHFIQIGSFYPHVLPQLVDTNPYVRSRKLASDGIAALADDTFHVVSLDAPFVVGTVPGMIVPMFEAYTRYAEGKLGMAPFAPAGGVNVISAQSIAEAIENAFAHGENGKAYLIGDENLTFADYFRLFFAAAGNPVAVPTLDQEHPMLPDAAILAGRGNVIAYEPADQTMADLRYRRHDVMRTINEIVSQYRSAS